jgi:hypothetical protein
MFQNEDLKTYLEEASSVKSQATVLAEWNMNYAENIDKIGNYKNRPTVSAASGSYVSEDSSTVTPTWYGYTDSNVISYGGIKDIDSTPYTFVNKNEKGFLSKPSFKFELEKAVIIPELAKRCRLITAS